MEKKSSTGTTPRYRESEKAKVRFHLDEKPVIVPDTVAAKLKKQKQIATELDLEKRKALFQKEKNRILKQY